MMYLKKAVEMTAFFVYRKTFVYPVHFLVLKNEFCSENISIVINVPKQ